MLPAIEKVSIYSGGVRYVPEHLWEALIVQSIDIGMLLEQQRRLQETQSKRADRYWHAHRTDRIEWDRETNRLKAVITELRNTISSMRDRVYKAGRSV